MFFPAPSRPRSRPTRSAIASGRCLALLALALAALAHADIPATPVMTLYRFNAAPELPYVDIERFAASGASTPAGTLAQGSTVIPCVVVRDGRPLTDSGGTPYVGFEIVVDTRDATPAARARIAHAMTARQALRVANHHCAPTVTHAIDVRNLYPMEKVPFFDPPRGALPATDPPPTAGELDAIVRAFHDSAQCAQAGVRLIGRRQALARAWDAFAAAHTAHWPANVLVQARHLDYTLRTALFEGHLERGCSAYGACERNIVALTIRNRAVERCFAREGCRAPGDFTGVASTVSQYNIWDEYLTQISGLTACYLRRDLATHPDYVRLQAMYAQNVADVQRILFGNDNDLATLFPDIPLATLKRTAHYYHAPAMGKCFPRHPRVEYMSGAIARKGGDYALIANTRIEVGARVADGYRFRSFRFRETDVRDDVEFHDDYPGFVVDARKVTLRPAAGCLPYGVPAGCRHEDIGRYRRTPMWLDAGEPLGLRCRIADRGASCTAPPEPVSVQVGGTCDTQMRPVSGVH